MPSAHLSGEGSSRSLSRQESSGIQSPSGGTYGSTYGESTTGYDHPPSKRIRTLPKEPLSASAYQDYQRSTQGTSSQGDLYQHYPPREAPRNNRSSFYSSETQPGPGYPSEYAFSQQRLDPSATVSPVNPQGSSWLGGFSQQQYGRPTGQNPFREAGAQYGYGQGTTTHTRQASQYVQPVPPERRLPSSVPSQYDNTRTYSQTPRQDPYAVGSTYAQSHDDRRSSYAPSQTYQPAPDAFSQLTPRTLPPPTLQPGGLPSIGPSLGAAGPSFYPSSSTQQSAGTPATSAGYSGPQSYYYAQYQGPQSYR